IYDCTPCCVRHDAILLLCFPVLHRVEASGSESKMNSSLENLLAEITRDNQATYLECIPAASGEQQVAREVDNTPSSSRKSGSLEAPVLTSWSERWPLRC
ncbi:hypothetical protein B0H14DRAFT_2895009, partial [Mycena olivaceomarginata]